MLKWILEHFSLESCSPIFVVVAYIFLVPSSSSVQFSSVAQLCLTLCDPMDCRTPGLHVHHQFPEFMQTHVR